MATKSAVTKAKVALPADINALYQAEMDALQKRISAPSGDRIMITQSKTFKLPDGNEVDSISAVVVDFVAANYYFTEAYERGNITPPVCFALGLEPAGLVPSENSPDRQAEACAGCWANQFGSSGKGKACQNTRLLALLPPDADAETPLSVLKVSPTAVKSFDGYVGSLARAHKKPVRAFVTQLSFSPEAEYPTLRFNILHEVEPSLAILAHGRMEEARARLLTEPDTSATAAVDGTKNKGGAKKPAKLAGRR